MARSMLIDITRCAGCGECTRACATVNGLSDEESTELSARHFTVIKDHHDGEAYVRKLCMHCIEPTCVSACLVGAFRKTSSGAVVYDEDKCIGCRYCMQACPFEVPRYEWSNRVPRVQKCNMCLERVESGGLPACVEACPFEATVFGERADLIQEAKKRIRDHPGEYVDDVYGVKEAGGTSVLFLSAIPFEQLGFPVNLPKEPIPQLSWKILREIPKYSAVASVFLFGLHWITARRAYVARIETERQEAERNKR